MLRNSLFSMLAETSCSCRQRIRPKGWRPLAEQQGMFIAFFSAPGKTASDHGEKSGPYAAALAVELMKPGLDHLDLFQNVKEAVLESTGGVQHPWESNGLTHRVYFDRAPKVDTVSPARLSEPAEAWDRIKDSKDLAALEVFATRYKGTFYSDLARERIEALR
jgi:hypothetical protein